MSLSIIPLLLHSDDVPAAARAALRAAGDAAEPDRTLHLVSAAHILHREAELDCSDARELVGLDDAGC